MSSSSSVYVEECVIVLYMHSLKLLNIGIRLASFFFCFFYQKWNKQEMLHIFTVVERQIMHASIRNSKEISNIDVYQD